MNDKKKFTLLIGFLTVIFLFSKKMSLLNYTWKAYYQGLNVNLSIRDEWGFFHMILSLTLVLHDGLLRLCTVAIWLICNQIRSNLSVSSAVFPPNTTACFTWCTQHYHSCREEGIPTWEGSLIILSLMSL